jgi:hypothetical protein
MPTSNHHKPSHPWDQACLLEVKRGNEMYAVASVDRGVNFFVLALEELGATPCFSCEGHPMGFYVSFEASYELAREIHSAGFFNVEIEGDNRWSIRHRAGTMRGEYNEHYKQGVLRLATKGWIGRFGPRLKKTLLLLATS